QLGPGKEAREQMQAPLSETDDPRWAYAMVRRTAETMAAATFAAVGNAKCRRFPGGDGGPGSRKGTAGGRAVTQPSLFADTPAPPRRRADSGPRFTPTELARLLRLPAPTPEQAAIIAAPVEPVLVVAGAGSGKTETMASGGGWLVANGDAHPDQSPGVSLTLK